MTTVENAPFSRGSTSAIASSTRSAGCVESSAAMISESEVELKLTPCSRSSACSSTALMRLPLWASASSRLAAACPAAVHRLRVLPLVGARRRVADVADRQVAAERPEVVLLEDLVDEAQRALGDDVAARVGRGDARRLLPAVLQGVEGEVRQARDVVLGRVDPEDAALVPRAVALVEVERSASGKASRARRSHERSSAGAAAFTGTLNGKSGPARRGRAQVVERPALRAELAARRRRPCRRRRRASLRRALERRARRRETTNAARRPRRRARPDVVGVADVQRRAERRRARQHSASATAKPALGDVVAARQLARADGLADRGVRRARRAARSIAGRPSGSGSPRSLASSPARQRRARSQPTSAIASPVAREAAARPARAGSGSSPTMPTTGVG